MHIGISGLAVSSALNLEYKVKRTHGMHRHIFPGFGMSLADLLLWLRGLKRLPAMRETWVRSLGREDLLEKEMQPTPVLLPGKSRGRWSLVGYSLLGLQRVGHDRATSLQLTCCFLSPLKVFCLF